MSQSFNHNKNTVHTVVEPNFFQFTTQENHEKLQQFYNNFLNHKYTINNLFEKNSDRAQNYSIDDLSCYLDYSKNWLDDDTKNILFSIADQNKLSDKIDDLFNGKNINTTENRAALHTALRDVNKNHPENISDLIQSTQNKIKSICNDLTNKKLLGFSKKPIDTIVNIGIGGSDLGPKMVYNALEPYRNKDINCYFVSNIDPASINSVLNKIDPETSLFIVCSKSFSTAETLANAKTARKWLLKFCQFEDLKYHFIAVSSAIDKVIAFGISPDNILPMWDWVGGRYSLWSAIGLSIALGTSYDNYLSLLKGANDLDKHFKSKSWSENMPVMLALLGIGYINFANSQSHALLPYCENLEYFPNYIQQLDMESNGKSVNIHNNLVNYNTGPIIWGAPGSNGQHAFHQLLHQGTHIIPADFIVPINTHYEPHNQHHALIANAFAQSKTLMDGYKDPNNRIYKYLKGNKPSNMFLMPELSPYYLGVLIALYEHKVFTQGAIWGINSFDQWGVERGKVVADEIIPYLDYNNSTDTLIDISSRSDMDCSTKKLINKFKELTNNV